MEASAAPRGATPPASGEGAPLHIEDVVCHIGPCPRCGQNIREPFNRLGGVVAFVHRLGGGRGRELRYCRLIVEPARTAGSRHRITIVPASQSLEEALYATVLHARAVA